MPLAEKVLPFHSALPTLVVAEPPEVSLPESLPAAREAEASLRAKLVELRVAKAWPRLAEAEQQHASAKQLCTLEDVYLHEVRTYDVIQNTATASSSGDLDSPCRS